MKTLSTSGALLVTLCLATNVLAQPTPPASPDAPPPAPPAAAADGSQDETPPSQAQLERDAKRAQADAERLAKQEGMRAKEEAKRAQAEEKRALAEYDRAKDITMNSSFGSWDMFSPGGRGEHAVVIRSSDADPKLIAAEEEDLNIMGRILEKALYHTGDDDQMRAMGINIRINAFGSGAPKNMQIEGYGAIFMLNVNFPLVGAPKESEEKAPKDPSNSAWDEARHEIYGGPPEEHHRAKMDYDPKRVETLKNSLLDALKSAANMRNLKSDESVTLVVTSGGKNSSGDGYAYTFQTGGVAVAPVAPTPPAAPVPPVAPVARNGGGSGGSGSYGYGGSGSRSEPVVARAFRPGHEPETSLTIRARKSDIDAFAKGKLNLDEFRNKAAILLY